MSIKTAKIDEKAGTITLTLDLEDMHPSKSGKTMLVGVFSGPTTMSVDGRVVTASGSCYVKATPAEKAAFADNAVA